MTRRLPLVLLTVTLGISGFLFWSSFTTLQVLEQQKQVFLRNRVASVAARIEALSTLQPADRMIESLADEEPGLLDCQIYDHPAEGDGLQDLWEGRELFRTGLQLTEGVPILRAFVPIHRQGELQIARIDLAANSADFLTAPAQRGLWAAGFGSLATAILATFTFRGLRDKAKAEQRQREMEHLAHVGEMSAVLAHEIRNPLGTIKGFAQLLAEKASAQQLALLGPVLSETERLENLVRDLLLYGRPPQPALREVNSLDVSAALRHHVPKGVEYEASAVDAITFRSDPDLLGQALLNLLRNSAEAVSEDTTTRISVSASRHGDEVVWTLCDDGPGLSDVARERLFESFFTTKPFGTGLGLTTTRKLVESLGGRFSIRNQPEGGTIAEIRLPVSLRESERT